MFRKLATVGVATLSLAAVQSYANVVVTDSSDAAVLTGEILGSGITLVGAASYTGATGQSGTFTGGFSAGLGFDSGIILTSGDASLAENDNADDGAGGSLGTAGDADLDALIPQSTFDAAVLEFEFQFGDGSAGGDLFFTFQFASEEYNEYVDSSFNDVFALFVDGINVAIAPDGEVVSINNVNCGNPYDAAHVGDNCGFFNNNDPDDSATPFAIEYDGFTNAFVATSLGLSAGTHTMKFAIADAGDTILDSAVFIQAGSFSDTDPTSVPEPGMLSLLGASLLGLGIANRRRRLTKKV